MKIGIIYATVGGTTRECAIILRDELKNHDVILYDISRETPEIDKLDLAVIGFPIRMGKAIKSMRVFLKNNAEMLKRIDTAYYICCGFVDCFEDYAEKCIPEELRGLAKDISCLGGSLDSSRFKGFDKIVVKAVRSEILGGGDNADERKDMCLPTIMEENIRQFALRLKS